MDHINVPAYTSFVCFPGSLARLGSRLWDGVALLCTLICLFFDSFFVSRPNALAKDTRVMLLRRLLWLVPENLIV